MINKMLSFVFRQGKMKNFNLQSPNLAKDLPGKLKSVFSIKYLEESACKMQY